MYSILGGEKELILNEEKSLNEGSEIAKPVDVKYNPQIPNLSHISEKNK